MARIHAVQAIFLLKCALYPYEPAVPSTSDSQRNLEGTVLKCVYSERQRRAVHNFLFIYLLDCMSETDSRPSCHSTLDVRLVSAWVDTATSASGFGPCSCAKRCGRGRDGEDRCSFKASTADASSTCKHRSSSAHKSTRDISGLASLGWWGLPSVLLCVRLVLVGTMTKHSFSDITMKSANV